MRRFAALAVVAVAFAIGGTMHLIDILRGGWLPYDYAPLAMNAFWTALLPLDYLVVALIVARRAITALTLGLGIMTADIAVNAYALFGFGWHEFTFALILQAAFFGFLLGATPFLWNREKRRLTTPARRTFPGSSASGARHNAPVHPSRSPSRNG